MGLTGAATESLGQVTSPVYISVPSTINGERILQPLQFIIQVILTAGQGFKWKTVSFRIADMLQWVTHKLPLPRSGDDLGVSLLHQ